MTKWINFRLLLLPKTVGRMGAMWRCSSRSSTITSSDDLIKMVSHLSKKLIQENNTLLKIFGKFLPGDT